MKPPLQLLHSVTAACGPEFIKKPYAARRPPNAHPTWGNCYVACEALYHLWAKDHGFKPHWTTLFDCNCSADCKGGTHWFLRNPKTGQVLDPTVEQFGGVIPDYRQGICCGFLTKRPSNRCKQMLARIKEQRVNHA